MKNAKNYLRVIFLVVVLTIGVSGIQQTQAKTNIATCWSCPGSPYFCNINFECYCVEEDWEVKTCYTCAYSGCW